MRNRNELAGTFTLDRESLIQAAKPPHFGHQLPNAVPLLHFALTEAQEWQLRRDLALMDVRRQQAMTDFDDQEVTRVFVRS